ncbi:unnamed protein product [Effrenium voratum]|uniref:Poly [ADP-ribose] polymerase n=1 Tax=Effrenium voratum TaxID=2562239 RepID=A0AA36JHS9_9DINO|nr:unnamed protein product [Effrenium voratum]
MGCCASVSNAEDPTTPVRLDRARPVTNAFHNTVHKRLRKLNELDEITKVPFILIELTGEGDGEGEIEVTGKDEYGVYEALENFFVSTWGCEKLDPGDDSEDTKIPFCKGQYRWPGFSVQGDDGLNNLGKKTMEIIDFMCGHLSWTLAVVNGGNVGANRDVRETQLIFKAPHPMNLVAPHLMVELRSAGFVEVCADLDEEHGDILESLDEYFADRFQAERIEGHEDFCDRYYQAGDGAFKGIAGSLESNFGLLCTDVCDRITQWEGWSLVACNASNYGADGTYSEQQMIFRRDYHPLGDSKYVQVILNGLGNIEVNGKHIREIHSKLDGFLRRKWGCERAGQFHEGETMCRRYTWGNDLNMLLCTAEVVKFFELQGWEIQVASQQQVLEDGNWCQEQQLLFRPGRTEVGTIEPHVFFELYAGEGDPQYFEDEETTQVLGNQQLRIRCIGPGSDKGRVSPEIRSVMQEFQTFVEDYLGGEQTETDGEFESVYACNVFMCRGKFENNLAQWTMRLCDWMVDTLGWSFIVCSLCNMGEFGQNRLQQVIFRFDGDKRALPVSKSVNNAVQEYIDPEIFPSYWEYEEVLQQQVMQRVKACKAEEKEALQQLVDATFKRVLTRDRVPDDDAENDEEMPYRIEVVHAFRSEHARLQNLLCQVESDKEAPEESFSIKTSEVETLLSERLKQDESYLYHGTNPSSAMSILKTGFVLDHAGSATGTMYGAGVYLAECSSKSDEYGRDDGGNTYPSLLAMLICRSYVGNVHVVDSAGDHVPDARAGGFDCICGDREAKVGTYREFVFFDERQVYPEYAIIYRRQYDKMKVPDHMVVPTTGTTGRFWQMKAGDWKNVPPEVNKVLIQAMKDGDNEVAITLHGTEYIFNLHDKKGVNTRTGNKVPLRAPMVR